ncbi:MAG: RHS repeat-associated core domain-containing protein, partial [Bacilli bacterium]
STGLYYLNARYYDPKNGRFITRDTYRGNEKNPNTLHLYFYCNNNPINYTDPSGHYKYPIFEKTKAPDKSYIKIEKKSSKYKITIKYYRYGKLTYNKKKAWKSGNTNKFYLALGEARRSWKKVKSNLDGFKENAVMAAVVLFITKGKLNPSNREIINTLKGGGLTASTGLVYNISKYLYNISKMDRSFYKIKKG